MNVLPLAAMIFLHYGLNWDFPTWVWVIFIIYAVCTPIVKIERE